ncbi:uncharacterized protein LOC107981564 [Nasonia vitripennis]|uniref:Uncharacterized protein n=1 Tax=Nasonia vitripennis TaxID=7425 RepID=A0A7M7QKS3_NASVI|nr:uncharacterized protein LOC107981564 [Nasonia vitripennis]XP_031788937.1 uncharacterized protein LOC107981564 [Nasonia vitripennis]
MHSVHEMVKGITNRQTPKVAVRPEYLPFKTSADIVAFDFAGDEAYDKLVNYLISLGGANYIDSAARYLKECKVDEDIFRHVTWSSSKRDGVLALKESKFAKACRVAMPADKKTLLAPQDDDFTIAMIRALKSAKEGFRRKMKRPAQNPAPWDQPEVQRQRLEEQHQREETNDRDDGEGNGANAEDNGAMPRTTMASRTTMAAATKVTTGTATTAAQMTTAAAPRTTTMDETPTAMPPIYLGKLSFILNFL